MAQHPRSARRSGRRGDSEHADRAGAHQPLPYSVPAAYPGIDLHDCDARRAYYRRAVSNRFRHSRPRLVRPYRSLGTRHHCSGNGIQRLRLRGAACRF